MTGGYVTFVMGTEAWWVYYNMDKIVLKGMEQIEVIDRDNEQA